MDNTLKGGEALNKLKKINNKLTKATVNLRMFRGLIEAKTGTKQIEIQASKIEYSITILFKTAE